MPGSSGLIGWDTGADAEPTYLSGLTTNATGDNTTTINAQLTTLAATQGANTGGATALLPRGVIMVGNLLVPNHVRLVGHGPGTVLRAVSGTTGAMIALAANHNRFAEVCDLRIDGNGENVTGISIDTQDVDNDEYADGMISLKNLFIHECGVDGIYMDGRGENITQNVRIRDCDRYGLNVVGVDNDFTNIMIGGSGSAGVRSDSANNRFTNVKSFYSGRLTPANGHGFWFDGSDGGHSNTCVNCEAQDNNAHGFLIDSFARVQLIGCLADSNNAGHSAAADQSGNGIHIINSSRCIIEAHSRDRGANTRPQKYALGLASGAAELKARITGNGNTTGNLLGGFHSQIDVSINAYGGRQSVAYAASITPDPTQGNVISVGTLTGDITINATATANTWTGQQLTFIFTQDGTGGRIVTYNAVYQVASAPATTANSIRAISFVYNGTNWVQI